MTRNLKKKKEIETLKAQEDNGEIDLYFYDGSGFSLVPNVPYCWQKKGETIQIPSSKSKTLQVLGFLRRDNTFRFYFAHGSVDSVTVVAVFKGIIKQRNTPTILPNIRVSRGIG